MNCHQDHTRIRSWMALNEEAAQLIQRTKYAEAEACLSRALSQLEERLVEARDRNSLKVDDDNDDDDDDDQFLELCVVDAQCPETIQSLEDLGAFVLYDKLFLVRSSSSRDNIMSTATASSSVEENDDHRLSANAYQFWYSAVLYNLGVCCHLLGLTSGIMDLHLTRAAYAYDSAIASLEQCDNNNSNNNTNTTCHQLWLELALLNNSAHILSHNFCNADSCVFDMTQNLHYLRHEEYAQRKRLLDVPTVQFFRDNVQNAATHRHAPQA